MISCATQFDVTSFLFQVGEMKATRLHSKR